MLKRLELIGFKSFADRTRFDFAPGISAVVGPNGSGKSNVVDAVRWLLGEQSAKSLRGGEMTDVIFNGSSTRKSLGLAEVTMTFDNSRRLLAVDGDEVQVTRRVYRDGAGEYLIDGQSARLKDIKELFLGTGAGHGAYSVIEQGRVDALLAATTKDRRQIFEEAAGISRFKARKLETLRKLEHVDADLIRVRDILQELDKNLRVLRTQAVKAQRYRELTTRLKDLRVAVGLAEYRELTTAVTAEEAELAALKAVLATATARAEADEEQLRKLDWDLGRTDDALRHQDGKLADARQAIAGHEAAAKSERGQITALEAELLRLGQQRAQLGSRTRTVEADAARAAIILDEVSQRAEAERARAAAAADASRAADAAIATLARQVQADRDLQFDLVSKAARLGGDAEVAKAKADRLRGDLVRNRTDTDITTARLVALDALLDELAKTDVDLRQRLIDARTAHANHTAARDSFRERADRLQHDLEARKELRSALRGRAAVLEGLERDLEGLGAGVRAVVRRVRAGEAPFADAVVGLVVELLTAPRDVAPLIDLALGDVGQRFVVRDATTLATLLPHLGSEPGRVGFLPYQPSVKPLSLATAAELVRCDRPGFEHLAQQLLGRVLIAEDLPTARIALAEHPGVRVVARTGEVLDPDGTVTVGPPHAEIGIISRKSELRELHAGIATLDADVTALETEQTNLRSQAEALDVPIRDRESEIAALAGEAGSLREQMAERKQVREQLADRLDLLHHESTQATRDLEQADGKWRELQTAADATEAEAAQVKARLAAADAAQAAAIQTRDARAADHTAAQVAVGRVTEQLTAAKKTRDDLDSELRQRRIDAVNLATAERSARSRLLDSELATLRATAAAATAYADKEARERSVHDLTTRRDSFRMSRDQLQHELKTSRQTWASRRERAHAVELSARDLAARRDALVSRLRDDYAVDLASIAGTGADDDPILLTAVDGYPQVEIDDLKSKVSKLGSVNLEALDELSAAESRESELRTQFDDLAAARTKLQQIIDQINTDSRRLFAETLSTVRTHFQELFRKLFGGGAADIILEDDTDILESGIEITARPPGKELTRISLLSGGERALTAVALLLAIFRSRPSPFCLLDEVDAAMDEANTARLAGLLQEFSANSQFIVITHKKRTMAVADVLYGVTMQESGISKLVAVRFEDWPDEAETAA